MTRSRRGSLFGVKDDMNQEGLNDHYKNLAKMYTNQQGRSSWAEVEQEEGRRLYEEGGLSMTRLLIDLLELTPQDSVVDLGSGNCRTAHQLNQLVSLVKPILCVDPVQEMLFLGSEFHNIRVIQATAMEFAAMDDINYSKIYLKSIVHHLGRGTLEEVLAGLYRQLDPGGRLLIETGGDTCSLPWFSRAVSQYNKLHSGLKQLLLDILSSIGFSVSSCHLAVPAVIAKRDLFTAFRKRSSSMLENLTDSEIEEGIQEVDSMWKDTNIRYSHSRLLILAKKKKKYLPE